MGRILVSISIVAIAVLFQNCSKVNFTDASAGVVSKLEDDFAAADLTSDVSISDDDAQSGSDSDSGSDSEEPSEVPSQADEDQDETSVEDGEGLYICILEGPGKSVRLGYVDGVLTENGHTPDTVCMSRMACEQIISQRFIVKGAERRGYCPDKNPHVYQFSDTELQSLIDSI